MSSERIKELMVKTGTPVSIPFDQWCSKFADLIEAEVRGDAEPVAWIITSERQDGTHLTHALMGRYKDVLDACDVGEPIPLYTHPNPAVVAQLVEALEKLARLGNGDSYGNSVGNEIAIDALKAWKGEK